MKDLKWTGRLTIIGLLLLVINFMVIGGGHGYYELLFFTFPFPCLILNLFDEINILVILILLIQYPLYGLILDKNKKSIKKAGLIILITHIVFALIAYQNMPTGFK
ncbi:hypothetical protein HKT18_02815 [Flavobacterium sp. IMCC34852]|uniref:Uncharacterized protein n=1 Tax=Flavobacterium rivulicola TaxID=2732161 RepID=A0A7Y3R729_9FLAO|nr:hypothetical protein [Flavobacterium sp. IMCC34852]NNT71139.1 hypothetical protein [Flavobacterium sp. IMCC34852]